MKTIYLEVEDDVCEKVIKILRRLSFHFNISILSSISNKFERSGIDPFRYKYYHLGCK